MNNLDIRKNKEIKKVDIILENLEIISVPVDFIESLVINDINNNIVYTNCLFFYNQCKLLYLKINSKFNITVVDKVYGERNTFNRLIDYKDITAIEVSFSTGEKITIYVDWWEPCVYENLNQNCEILEDGSLEISVTDDNNEDELKISFEVSQD